MIETIIAFLMGIATGALVVVIAETEPREKIKPHRPVTVEEWQPDYLLKVIDAKNKQIEAMEKRIRELEGGQ